jgi:hypothetical protein
MEPNDTMRPISVNTKTTGPTRVHKGIAWADRDVDRITEIVGHPWVIWYVVYQNDLTSVSWQAAPDGATTSVCSAGTADELVERVREYEDDLPKHIAATLESLMKSDPVWVGQVERLRKRHDALTALQASLHQQGT